MATTDIREQLSLNHSAVMAKVDSLRNEANELRCYDKLEDLRQAWVSHILAEETVVYHALESPQGDAEQADDANERLLEHELLQCFFERLSHSRPGTAQWVARLDIVAKLMRRHMEEERDLLFSRLERDFKAEDLSGMGRDFGLAREKISMLEQAKAS
ncbi:MAG TPA: hemerythrin domain-containing protein [Usitatibacter sp.]